MKIPPDNLQARLSGAEHAHLKVGSGATGLAEKIAKIKGVKAVNQVEADSLEFDYEPGQDVRPEVARLVIQSNLDLLELRAINLSLEEIFLQLTREESGAAKKVE